jgi:hypothetical protein
MQRLQLVREAKLPSLPTDDGKLRRLEASGVLAYEGQLNVIFDKVSQLARIDASCASNPGNAWLGNPDRSPGHEDIASSPYRERFYVLVEAVAYPGGERATGAWSSPAPTRRPPKVMLALGLVCALALARTCSFRLPPWSRGGDGCRRRR